MSRANTFDSYPWATNFHRLASQLIITNEIGEGDPYRIANVAIKSGTKLYTQFPESGYSFGFVQWDLANNVNGRTIFTSILDQAVSKGLLTANDEAVILIKVKLKNKDFLQNPKLDLSDREVGLINKALDSPDGRDVINSEHKSAVSEAVSSADRAIALATVPVAPGFWGSDAQPSVARLFLADFHNQLRISPGRQMERFLQGQRVTLGGGSVQMEGATLGLDDLVAFYFSTSFAQTPVGLNDELRRFTNVVRFAGGYQPSSLEEAVGMQAVWLGFVADRAGSLPRFQEALGTFVAPAINFVVQTQGEPYAAGVLEHLITRPRGEDPGESLQGTDQNDLVLGASSHGILIGGAGDDVLRGEAGKDLYVYNSGDGNDVIVDTSRDPNGDGVADGDGQGAIVYDEHVLGGGIHHTTDAANTFASLDGRFTFVKSGNDLVVTSTSDTTGGSITIKDWQDGQLGITLANAPDIATNFDNGGQTRTVFQKVDHYVQVGTDPDGNAILEPVFAPFFDDNGNNTQSGTPQLGGLRPPLGDDNNLIHAQGGNDAIASGAGNDQLFGDAGADTIFAAAGNDAITRTVLSGRGSGARNRKWNRVIQEAALVIGVLLLIWGISPQVAHAQSTDKYVGIVCSADKDELLIIPNSQEEGVQVPRGDIYDAYKRVIRRTCKLKKRTIKITIKYNQARPKGECGAWPHAFLTIKENSQIIVGDVTFHACSSFTSIHRVLFNGSTGWQVCIGRDYDLEEPCTAGPVRSMAEMDNVWDQYISSKASPHPADGRKSQ